MIEVTDLHRSFGPRTVLDGVSFSVPRGEVAGFLGQNGAGKTTTMRILTSFLPPNPGVGSARVAGFDVRAQPNEVCRRVGYLPESMPVPPELRVGEYLRFRGRLKGLSGSALRSRVEAVIELCDLGAARRRLLGVLSKGFRQRVGLADALLHEPEVLILDEPTSGLDPQQVVEVRSLIERLRETATVLLSSHVLGEVEQMCDQIIILSGGKIRVQESRSGWRERLERAGTLEVLFQKDPPKVQAALRALPGVREVTRADDRWVLQSDRDSREAVASLAAEKGWLILELIPRPATLESLFLEVVHEEGA